MMHTLTILLFNIFIILFQMIGLLLVIISEEMLKSNIIYLANTLDNWSSTPISKIQLFDLHCPVDYEPLLVNKYIISCDFNLYKDFLELNSHYTFKVFMNEKNQTFCEERLKDFSYFHHRQVKHCNKNEKDCGILDTLGNRLCFSKQINCPINGISIREHKSNDLIRDIAAVNTSTKLIEFLPINKNYSLAYKFSNNDNDSNIIVDLDIIQGN